VRRRQDDSAQQKDDVVDENCLFTTAVVDQETYRTTRRTVHTRADLRPIHTTRTHVRSVLTVLTHRRSFVVAGARAWNDLPATLRNTELTMDTFCKHLKTVSFTYSRGRNAFVYKCPYLLMSFMAIWGPLVRRLLLGGGGGRSQMEPLSNGAPVRREAKSHEGKEK